MTTSTNIEPSQLSNSALLDRFDRVKQQVHQLASGRQVRLVAVSKRKPASDILSIYRSTGHLHFGENYVNELLEKADQLPQEINWHFIGTLQTNKCKILGAIPNLFAVETVDSLHKAELLERAREKLSNTRYTRVIQVYLQVNTSQEEKKSGFKVLPTEIKSIETTDLYRTADYIKRNCQWLNLAGLMTIGSIDQSKSNLRTNQDFELLNQLKHHLSISLAVSSLGLSMGMSADFQLAIRMGSDNVRIGSSIFGERAHH